VTFSTLFSCSLQHFAHMTTHSVIPIHASMLCLACPSLRVMAPAPPAAGLAPWKFVLSCHLTDAAARAYFSFLYYPFTPVLSFKANDRRIVFFAHAFPAVTWKWCGPRCRQLHRRLRPLCFQTMQVHESSQTTQHRPNLCRHARLDVDYGMPYRSPRSNGA
jgi:hypothetical protein